MVAPWTPAVMAQVEALPAAGGVADEPAELTVANRRMYTLRADVAGATPAERVVVIKDTLAGIIARGGPLTVTTRELPEGIALMVDGQFLCRVLHADVNPETGETTRAVADQAARNLETAFAEIRESRDPRAMLSAAGYALLVTLVVVGLLWLLRRGYARLAGRMRELVQRRFARLAPGWGSHLAGSVDVAELSTMPLRLAAWLVALLLLYEWAALVLDLFPYTRPWGEALFGNLVDALGRFGSGMLEALPGLLFVALIFLVTRFIVRVVRVFFEGVQTGRVRVAWVDDATAPPTGRLLTVIIWLFALVAAYPYLPGSGSEAFKGIGVFVGLMLSIGASGIVNQAVSGLMLMYTRALRPGEFVQIGEAEGTVRTVGFLTTRIETLRHEEINIPNAVIAGSVTRNFSRLAGDGGIRVATKVTIGYDVPWRQVQAMLQVAAERSAAVSKDPPPRVLQTALQDFYVEYTLLVSVMDPSQRFVTLNELHGHIQDVFNEHGVQIMSPNYEADPAQPKVVPRERWFEPPAA
jgi:small-conductance mechanosensitive channel